MNSRQAKAQINNMLHRKYIVKQMKL